MTSITTETHFLYRNMNHTWKIFQFSKSPFFDGEVLFGSKFCFEDGKFQLSVTNNYGGLSIKIITHQQSKDFKISYSIRVEDFGSRFCEDGNICSKTYHLTIPGDFIKRGLSRDCLTINCTLTSRRTTTLSLLLPREESKGNLEKLSHDLQTLLTTASMADLDLEVEGQKIPVHSVILSSRSPVFSAMLNNDMLESRTRNVKIPDFTVKAITNMLNYIYTGKLDVKDMSSSLLSELYAVADKYDLLDLKEMCRQSMIEDLNRENIEDYLLKAVEHYDQGMLILIGNYLANNPQVICTLKQEELVKEIPNFLDRMLLAIRKNYGDDSK